MRSKWRNLTVKGEDYKFTVGRRPITVIRNGIKSFGYDQFLVLRSLKNNKRFIVEYDELWSKIKIDCMEATYGGHLPSCKAVSLYIKSRFYAPE
jgi:hypothetical protein